MKKTKEIIKILFKCAFKYMLPAILPVLIIYLLFKGISNFSSLYISEPNIDNYLSYTEYDNLMNLMYKGVVVSADDIIANIIQYYNFIITLILGLLGFVVFFTLYLNNKKIEQEAFKHAGNIAKDGISSYLATKEHDDIMNKYVKKHVDEHIKDSFAYDDISDLTKNIENQKEYANTKIENIEKDIIALVNLINEIKTKGK